MTKATSTSATLPAHDSPDPEVVAFRTSFDERSPLDELVRGGAQAIFQAAIHTEIDECLPNVAPKATQSKMKKDLHAIWEAATKQQSDEAMGHFKDKHEAN